MLRIIYQFVFFIGYLLMLPSFLRRMWRRGGYRAHFSQRFGRYSPQIMPQLARGRLWIHAVSVGEAFVAGQLVNEFRRQAPDLPLLISTTSSTGYAVCEKFITPGDVLIYYPADFRWMVRRALNAIRPLALVLTESEIWPNMIWECARRNIPVVLVNGRISDRSFPRYKALRRLFGPILRSFCGLLVQFRQDRDRLIAIGADPSTTEVMGTVKFDVTPPDAAAVARAGDGLRQAGIGQNNLVLLGASTWPGEEATLLEAYQELRRSFPALRLVLVPRHMERGDEVEADIKAAGLTCLRRSRTPPATEPRPEQEPDNNTVLLVDTTGELFSFCACADLVFVGKTLYPHTGGQNMIEPASLGKAVVTGPHTGNFSGVMSVLRDSDAILEIADAGELVAALRKLLENPVEQKEIGNRAAAAVAAQAGVLERSAARVLELCKLDISSTSSSKKISR